MQETRELTLEVVAIIEDLIEGIYVAGDCASGASLIVRALKNSRDTAESSVKKYCENQG